MAGPYFVDAQGQIRHHHFGEGEYEGSEKVIQRLLTEAGIRRRQDVSRSKPHGVEAAADWDSLKSPENYLGYERTENFASPGGAKSNSAGSIRSRALKLNEWALAGEWTMAGRQPC